MGNAEDRKYYIDFSSVRGGNIIKELGRTIARLSPDKPTCQLFTGHIGCGKSTELQRLKADLEEQGFHVVYFESSQVLEMADVDVTDIMLAIARSVSESLEAVQIKLKPGYFANLFRNIAELLQTPIEFSEAKFSLSIFSKVNIERHFGLSKSNFTSNINMVFEPLLVLGICSPNATALTQS